MKKLLIPVLTFCCLLNTWSNSAVGNKFIQNNKKIDIGSLYIYENTDYKGNNPYYEYLYISDLDEIEYVRDLYNIDIGLLHYKSFINWDYFMISREEFTNILVPSVKKHYKSGVTTKRFNKKGFDYRLINIEKGKEKTEEGFYAINKLSEFPYLNSGNCTPDIGLFFRFYNPDSSNNTISIVDVWQKAYVYEVIQEKDEVVEGTLCIKYRLKPTGAFAKILDKDGYVWLAKNDPRNYVVKFKLNLRISFEQVNEMVTLKEIKSLSRTEWEDFIESIKKEKEIGLSF